MTQSQIQYFLTVAQEMSFSKAAETLYVSQPAVSRQVSQLERELGVALFERTNQGVMITAAGRKFETFFRETQRQFQKLREQVCSGSDAVQGIVNIGCAEGWDLSQFYPALSDYLLEKYPKLRLNLFGFNLNHILPALYRGEVDVVIASQSLLNHQEKLSTALLTQSRGILLFSAHHPLAGKAELTLVDFKDEPFYVTAPPSMKEASIEILALCAEANFVPNIEYVHTLSAAYMKLSSGRGVLLCNDLMMAKSNPIFAALPLDLQRDIGLAWLTDAQSPAVPFFVHEILSWFRHQ